MGDFENAITEKLRNDNLTVPCRTALCFTCPLQSPRSDNFVLATCPIVCSCVAASFCFLSAGKSADML